VTIEWAMSELLRRPDAMAAATDELNRVVGRTRWVHPVAPLLVPHQAREKQGPVVPAQQLEVPRVSRRPEPATPT